MPANKIHQFHVAMTCDGCAGAVERVLNKIKDRGIEKIEISVPNQTVQVTTSLPQEEILEVIKKTGKQANYVKSM